MRNYFKLTAILLKISPSMFQVRLGNRSKNIKYQQWLLMLALLIGLSSTAISIYAMISLNYTAFAAIGQTGLLVNLLFVMECAIVFVFSLFLIPSIFYFAKDIDNLLPLPLTPTTIIASKFTVVLFYEYLTGAVIMLPLLAAFISHNAADISFIIMFIIAFLTLPIFPLALSGIITVLVLSFSKFGKSRDTFNFISSILVVIIAVGISMSSVRIESIDMDMMIQRLSEGNNSLMNTVNTLFVHVPYAAKALVNGSLLSLLVYVAVVAASFGVFCITAKAFYFKGLIGIGEAASSAKKLSEESFSRSLRSRNVFTSYIGKEFKLLLRSPSFFINCLLMTVLLPILLFLPFFLSIDNSEMAEIYKLIDGLKAMLDFSNARVVSIFTAACGVSGMVISTMNSISVTCLSREGSNYYFMKVIPVSYTRQINAKVTTGMLVSTVGFAIIYAVLLYIVSIPLYMAVMGFVVGLMGVWFTNYFSVFFDLINPILTWESEQQAVKQNFNVLWPMLLVVPIGGVVVLTGIFISSIPVIILLLILDFIAYRFSISTANRILPQL